VRDLDQVRSFLSGMGPPAFFDLPWIPLYLAICFVFHVWLGLAALVGALLLIALTILTEFRTRGPARDTVTLGQKRNALAEANRRMPRCSRRWACAAAWARSGRGKRPLHGEPAADRGCSRGLGAASKVVRMALQSAVLGIGAYLVIHQQVSAGAIIASSILTARARGSRSSSQSRTGRAS
jgi:ATP-binding cassette subfamily C protein